MVVAVITTSPNKEGGTARDLCDCMFLDDKSVECSPLAPGVFYIKFLNFNIFYKCINLKYFKSLLKRIILYDYMVEDLESINCNVELADGTVVNKGAECTARGRRIGKYYFLRVGKNF